MNRIPFNITHDTAVPFILDEISLLQKEGFLRDEAARECKVRYPREFLMAIEVIGSWPSDDVQIRAIQRVK